MSKEQFEKDILEVLKKHGYKIEGIQRIMMRFDVNETPNIDIEYLGI